MHFRTAGFQDRSFRISMRDGDHLPPLIRKTDERFSALKYTFEPYTPKFQTPSIFFCFRGALFKIGLITPKKV